MDMGIAHFPFQSPTCKCKPMDITKHVAISHTKTQCKVCKETWAEPHNEFGGNIVMF